MSGISHLPDYPFPMLKDCSGSIKDAEDGVAQNATQVALKLICNEEPTSENPNIIRGFFCSREDQYVNMAPYDLSKPSSESPISFKAYIKDRKRRLLENIIRTQNSKSFQSLQIKDPSNPENGG